MTHTLPYALSLEQPANDQRVRGDDDEERDERVDGAVDDHPRVFVVLAGGVTAGAIVPAVSHLGVVVAGENDVHTFFEVFDEEKDSAVHEKEEADENEHDDVRVGHRVGLARKEWILNGDEPLHGHADHETGGEVRGEIAEPVDETAVEVGENTQVELVMNARYPVRQSTAQEKEAVDKGQESQIEIGRITVSTNIQEHDAARETIADDAHEDEKRIEVETDVLGNENELISVAISVAVGRR